jgi:hypothetical protein
MPFLLCCIHASLSSHFDESGTVMTGSGLSLTSSTCNSTLCCSTLPVQQRWPHFSQGNLGHILKRERDGVEKHWEGYIYRIKTDHASSLKLSTWKITGRCSGKAVDLCSGGARVEHRPGHYLAWSLSWLSSVPLGILRENSSIRQPTPCKSFQIHQSLIILVFDLTQYTYWMHCKRSHHACFVCFWYHRRKCTTKHYVGNRLFHKKCLTHGPNFVMSV